MLPQAACPSCQKNLVLPASAKPTSRIRCPSCQSLFTAADTAPSAPAATLDFAPPPPGAKADEGTLAFVPGEAMPSNPAASATTVAPLRVGRFEIRRELGEGAFGKVYEAHDSQLDRAVALKVAKLDRGDAAQRIKRFLREAKSAANLRHPHIVPLYEYGQDGDQFYIASAFIQGKTLADDLEARQGEAPDLERATRLIRQLAEALSYAHSQGIVHRDVKPANTMIDEHDEPLVLDFGLATRQEEAEKLTHAGQVMGTPRYMAPEQAKGKSGAALPASDQYSLGVMLFEMITGKPLFEGTVELVMFHQVETEPPRPRSINRAISRDLETMCLKCLEKDAQRRYASAADLAEDLRRYQAGEPIHARRVGAVERIVKWSRRHRGVALLAGTIAMLLFVGSLVSAGLAGWALTEAHRADGETLKANEQTVIAKDNERKAKDNEETAKVSEGKAKDSEQKAKDSEQKAKDARAQAEKLKKIAEGEKLRALFVREYLATLFLSNDPTGLTGAGLLPTAQAGKDLTARAILEEGRKNIDKLEADPLTQAALLDTIGEVSRSLGESEKSLPLLKKALELRQKHLDPDHPELAASLIHLGNWHTEVGNIVDAERHYLDAIAIYTKRHAAETLEAAEAHLRYAAFLTSIGEPEAEKWARGALKTRMKLLGAKHRDTSIAKMSVGASLLDQSKYAEALPFITEAMEYISQAGAKEKGGVLEAITDYQQATVTTNLGFHAAAERSYRSAVEKLQKALGKDHVYTAILLTDLGQCLLEQKKNKEAESVLVEALRVVRNTVGLEHPRSRALVSTFADLMAKEKRLAEGQLIVDEMLQAHEKRFGRTSRWRLRLLSVAGQFAASTKQTTRAEEIAREVVVLMTERTAPLSRADDIALSNFANALGDDGDLDLVTKLHSYLFQYLEQSANLSDHNPYVNFGVILNERKKYKEAIAHFDRTWMILKDHGSQNHKVETQLGLGIAHWATGNFAEAERTLVNAATIDSRQSSRAVEFFIQQGRHEEALEHVQKYQKSAALSTMNKARALHQETLLRLLTGKLTAGDMTPRLTKLADVDKNFDIACYRARALAAANPKDADQESERPKNWAKTVSTSTHPVLAQALCLSHAENDRAVLSVLKQMPKSNLVAATHLRDTLRALAAYRIDKKVSSREDLEKSVQDAENYLVTMASLKNPAAHGYLASLQLDLAWLCQTICRDLFTEVMMIRGTITLDHKKDRVKPNPAVIHEVKLEAGVQYTIDLKSAEFDSYLRLENRAGVELAKDDDSGGELHARITIRPSETGTYRIIATSFNGRMGAYQLRVIRAKNY